MEMFQKLVAYKKMHKNTLVPSKYNENPQLGEWVGTQRSVQKNGEMLPNRLSLLNSIGFVWKVDMDDQWNGMFQKLVAYKRLHNDTLVPQEYKEDTQLGLWVMTQRRYFSTNKLLKVRFNQLESIGFDWSRRPFPALI